MCLERLKPRYTDTHCLQCLLPYQQCCWWPILIDISSTWSSSVTCFGSHLPPYIVSFNYTPHRKCSKYNADAKIWSTPYPGSTCRAKKYACFSYFLKYYVFPIFLCNPILLHEIGQNETFLIILHFWCPFNTNRSEKGQNIPNFSQYMFINTKREIITEDTILPQIFCNYVSKKSQLSYDFYFRTKQMHAHTTTAANKEKIYMYTAFLLLEASKQKPETEENRRNALFFTLVWWSNVKIPKEVLPSLARYAHFKGNSSEIQKFECN